MKYWIGFSLVVVLSSCTGKFGKILKSTDNEYKYKMAEKFYAEKKYAKAQELYSQLMSVMRGTTRYEDMNYKFAYTSFYLKDYENSELLFKTYVENFPTGLHLEEAYYMRGYSFFLRSPRVELDQTPTSKAMSLMQAFMSAFPNSDKLKDAQNTIAKCKTKLEEKEYRSCKLYLNMEQYKAAYTVYDILMNDYPDSEKSDLYLYESIKSSEGYARMSMPYRQLERYQKVVDECDDFEARFPNSSMASKIKQIKTYSNNYIKYIKNEQIKETSKS